MPGWQSERPLEAAAPSSAEQEGPATFRSRDLAALQHTGPFVLNLSQDRRSVWHPGDQPRQAASRAAADRAVWIQRVRAFRRSVQLYNEFVHQQRRRPGGPTLVATATRVLPTEPEPHLAAFSKPQAEASLAPNGSSSPLTARQREVAGLIAAGKSNAAIAEELVLSPGTVANHVEHILNRLGFKNRSQVAVWAVHEGLLAEDQEQDLPV